MQLDNLRNQITELIHKTAIKDLKILRFVMFIHLVVSTQGAACQNPQREFINSQPQRECSIWYWACSLNIEYQNKIFCLILATLFSKARKIFMASNIFPNNFTNYN